MTCGAIGDATPCERGTIGREGGFIGLPTPPPRVDQK